MWKSLGHPNIVPFIGVTRTPMQFVLEWMPNGTLTEYVNANPDANRVGLVGSSSVTTAIVMMSPFQAIGRGIWSYLSSLKTHYTRRLERCRYLLSVILIYIDIFWPGQYSR